MVKMFLIKFEGKSSNYFKNGETYVGRTGKDGAIYMFNDKSYWSLALSNKMTRANFIKPIDIEKVFYVNNHKEALSYPQIAKVNWGIDLKRLLDGEEFTFKRTFFKDIVYTGKFLKSEDGEMDIHTSWIDPDLGDYQESTLYGSTHNYDDIKYIIELIKEGSWIVTQKESV